MFERAYRQRLEADVARWQAEGVITPAVGEAIRNSLSPSGRASIFRLWWPLWAAC